MLAASLSTLMSVLVLDLAHVTFSHSYWYAWDRQSPT